MIKESKSSYFKKNQIMKEDLNSTEKINKKRNYSTGEIEEAIIQESNINVSIKIRPVLERELNNKLFNQCLTVKDNEIYVIKSNKTLSISKSNDNNNNSLVKSFKFDKIFDQDTTQEEVFNSIGIECIKHINRNFNSTIFAYGQTGSGKTYTIEGKKHSNYNSFENYGLVPRIIKYLSDNKSNNQKFFISALQIYLDNAVDIMNENSKSKEIPLKISENFDSKIKAFECKDLIKEEIINFDQGLKLFMKAANNRCVRQTNMNIESSRGHIIYTIYSIRNNITSKLNIVDLAGSERIKKSGCSGIALKEATSVNKSLMTLINVVNAIVTKKHVPIRDSILTKLLADSLLGNSLTYLIANASPSLSECVETLCTLSFAHSCSKIKTFVTSNTNNFIEAEKILLNKEEKKVISKKEKDFPWKNYIPEITEKVVIVDNTKISYFDNNIKSENCMILLHGYPSSKEELLHWFPSLSYYNIRVIAIDQKGCGNSEGSHIGCNTKMHFEKFGPVDTIIKLMEKLNIKESFIGGYDWGAGIAISCSIKYPKIFKKTVILCASYNEQSGNELKCIINPCLIIWEKLDQFHPWSKWKPLAEKIPNKTIKLLNIKKYNPELTYNSYESESDNIMRSVIIFLGFPDPLLDEESIDENIIEEKFDIKGNRIQANILINISNDQKFLSQINIDKKDTTFIDDFIYQLKEQGSYEFYKNFKNNEKYVRNLPLVDGETLKNNPGLFVKLGIWNRIPNFYENMTKTNLLKENQEILVMIPCSNNIKSNLFLKYDKSFHDKFLSPYAKILKINDELKLVTVEVLDINDVNVKLDFSLEEIEKYNSGQIFEKLNGTILLEDGLKADYNNNLIKSKIYEIAINSRECIDKLDFSDINCEKYQLEFVKIVRETMNVKSFFESVDRERNGRTNCIGKLGSFGQAQCHGFSSLIAGYLIPFQDLLGLEIIYRGGNSYFNKNEFFLNNNVESHQWIQLMLRPFNNYYCVDGWHQTNCENFDYLKIPLKEALQKFHYPNPTIKLNCKVKKYKV